MNAVEMAAFSEGIFLPAAVVAALIVLAAVLLIPLRRYRPRPCDLLVLRESGMTGVLGIALWLELLALLYSGIALPDRLFTSTNARLNTAVFLLVSAAAGAVALLYRFVKCVVVREEELIYVNLFGVQKALAWNRVEGLSGSIGKRLAFLGPSNKTLRVGGEPKGYRTFLRLASERLPKTIDRGPIRVLERGK